METRGIPLDIILEKLKDEDLLIDWKDFIDTAFEVGWSIKTIMSNIECLVEEYYGKECINKIKWYIKNKC